MIPLRYLARVKYTTPESMNIIEVLLHKTVQNRREQTRQEKEPLMIILCMCLARYKKSSQSGRTRSKKYYSETGSLLSCL